MMIFFAKFAIESDSERICKLVNIWRNYGQDYIDRFFPHSVVCVSKTVNDAGLKCAARGSLKIQDPKSRHLGTIAQLCVTLSS